MKRPARSLFLLALTLSARAATPAPDQLLSGDVLGVFTIPDYARAKSTWSKWPASQLWDDPAMKPFRDKLTAKVKSDLLAPLEREFGMKLSDYQGLAQGQVTLAVTQNGWEGKGDPSPGVLLLVDTKDKSELLKANLATLKKKWVESGKQTKTDKIRDIEFTTLIFSTDDLSKNLEKAFPDPNFGNETLDGPKAKKPGRKVEWLVGQSESLFILGNSEKAIEKVLLRQSGGAVPCLAEQASFAANYTALFRDSLGYGWINIKTIVDIFNKPAPAADASAAGLQPGKILSALGLTGLRTLAFNLRDTGDGCLAGVQLSVPETERKGIFKILFADARDASPPPFVPADAVKFSRWRLDIQKAFAALESMLVEINPQTAGVIKLVVDNAGKDKDPNFDLRKNLIANLGDDVLHYQKNPRNPTLAELQNPPSLYLVGSPRAEQLAASVNALGSLVPKPKLKEREFLGRKVYTMSLPNDPGPRRAKGGGENTLSYAASGSYVALSTDPATLEEFLRGNSEKSLRETAGLADAAQKVGGMGTGLFGYENQNETVHAALDILKKESGSLASLIGRSPFAERFGLGEDDKKFREWFDLSLLPSFDKISKYFYLNVWSGSVGSEGLSFKVFSPTPPQLKK